MIKKYQLKKTPFIPTEYATLVIPQPNNHSITDDNMYIEIKNDIHNYFSNLPTKNEIKEYNYENTKEKFIVLNELGNMEKKQIAYHFFQLNCKEYTEAVFCIRCSKRHKIWINDILFTVTNLSEQILLVKLNKGSNTIVIETGWARPGDNIFLRISSYQYECEEGRGDRLINGSLRNFDDMKFLCYKTNFLFEGEVFSFILFSNNNISFNNKQPVKMELFDSETGYVYINKEIFFGKREFISTKGIEYKNVEELNSLRLKLTYRYNNSEKCILRLPLYLYDITPAAERYIEEALKLHNSGILTEYDKLCLDFKIDQIKKSNQQKVYESIQSLKGNINSIKSGYHMDTYIYSHGDKRVFFYSNLDNTVRAYTVYVPHNYSDDREYPLIIHFSTGELTNYSQFYKNYTYEDVISVDISQRGFTMGSYIGEAAIFEALEDIYRRFSINKQRIYLIGHSNGAYAVWAMAQNYPHMFAGALIVSGGVDCNLISNMNNIYILNISSENEKDYMRSYVCVSNYLKRNKRHESLKVPKHCHNTLMFEMSNSINVFKLLKNKSEKFPEMIEYSSKFNRHKKAYWIELQSVISWNKYAKIKAIVKGNDIHISTNNISGFTVNIPPYIDKEHCHLIINDNKPIAIDKNKDVIHIKKNKKGYGLIEGFDNTPKKFKGMGLIDVYCGPLTVVNTLHKLNKIANALATPKSNGANHYLLVDYPVIHINNMSDEYDKRNLIIIDNNSVNKKIKKLKEYLPVYMDANGYVLNGERYDGKYCAMMIIKNPLDERLSILYINSNDTQFMNKNLFLRKMFLPAYSNGFHPYLNNEILIFDEHGYKVHNL